MKRIFLFVLCFGCCQMAHSQVLIALLFGKKLNTDKMEFGLMISPTLSNVTNMDCKPRLGLGIALYMNVKLSENLFFHPEASPKAIFGSKHITPYATGYAAVDDIYLNDPDASVQRNIKALSLPLLMRYRIKGLLFAELGPQADLMFKSKDVFKTKIDGNPISYTTNVNDDVSLFDIGISGGLEYKLKKDKGMGISVRYYYGLTDVMTKIAGSQKNTAWYFNVSIPIGVNSQKQK